MEEIKGIMCLLDGVCHTQHLSFTVSDGWDELQQSSNIAVIL